MTTKRKKNGKVFTPEPVVKYMLYSQLWGCDEIDRHIIDNSCGDGAFLCEIVRHYCEMYIQQPKGIDLKTVLETYIHGIEIDPVEYKKCIERLDKIAREYGVTEIKWDIQNRDALSCHDYDGKMDYVIANPPYIRTHDIACDLSGYTFTSEGMKDIYLAFYELGFRMLKETGTMCYIAPSSWFSSLAGQKMRDYVMDTKCLLNVHDFGHTQLFENATTYVSICVFRKTDDITQKRNYVQYINCDKPGISVSYEDMYIDEKFYFGTHDQLDRMREIIEYGKNLKKEDKAFEVKNGYATLADSIFIMDVEPVGLGNIIPVVKSSTGKINWCIYPYDKNGKLLKVSDIDHATFKYLLNNREKLDARATSEPWYAFGRTQAINDTYRDKWAIKSIVKTVNDCNPVHTSEGTGVYGGLYILPKTVDCNVEDYLISVLKSQDFMNYVRMLGKYKSGGYYTFSSKELENYLNWTWKERMK